MQALAFGTGVMNRFKNLTCGWCQRNRQIQIKSKEERTCIMGLAQYPWQNVCLPHKLLFFYLKEIGNTRLPNQRDLKFRVRPRPLIASKDGSVVGWFGRVGPQTHFLYAAYPCLAVFMKRIQEDWNITQNPEMEPDWNVRDDIAPVADLAGIPTVNLPSWTPANRLAGQQV
ncbi:hypothetical protein M0804_013771 [Polistes exclamans]|nr:hypothetical protein M0804_013771 [Polistes exclamans]